MIDWQAFIFDPTHNWISRLEHLARKRLIDENLADQAFEQALAKLQKDNWARLNKFKNKSSPSTFLITVYRNLIEDFAISKFGKCRPPVWVQKLGEIWKTIHKRLCCEKRDTSTVCHALQCEEFSFEQIRQMALTVKGKIPGCGETLQQLANNDEFNVESMQDEHSVSQEESSTHYLFRNILQALSELMALESQPEKLNTLVNSLNEKKTELQSAMDISSQDILILKLAYQDGMKISAIARMLNQPDHQVRKQNQQALKHLRQCFEASGITTNALFE